MSTDFYAMNQSDPIVTSHYVPRPRIDKILDQATRGKMVFVVAGTGYGKTQAVYNYVINQPKTLVRWLQLTESDNLSSNLWEKLAHTISLGNPKLATKMKELSFPETNAQFQRFIELIKTNGDFSQKIFIVLDDSHLVTSESVLTFLERCMHAPLPEVCVILISRREPDVNAMPLFSKGNANTITEDDLRFTESEIREFFKQNDVSLDPKELPNILEATTGWALAIKLLVLALKSMSGSLDLALDSMKLNIFKLLETEAWSNFPESVQKVLLRLSLISDIPLSPLREILSDSSFTKYFSQLSAFVWFDSFINDYRIQPFYLEFIKNKQHILSHEERQNTYEMAAEWCFENGLLANAVNYYAKSYQYKKVFEIITSYPFKLPYETCEYFLKIIEGIELTDDATENHSALILKHFVTPLLYMGMGNFDEASSRSFATIREFENENTPEALSLLASAYNNLAYIETYICTVTHEYKFAEYLRKAVDYHRASGIPPAKLTGISSTADLRSFACLVGIGAEFSKFDELYELATIAAPYTFETFHGLYYGNADLIGCEIAFFKNKRNLARNLAHDAILKAREKNQYSIVAMAQYYLLRLAIHDGDYTLVKEMLRQIQSNLDIAGFWDRQLYYDLSMGSFFCCIGLSDSTPSWLIIDEKENTSLTHIPVREVIASTDYYLSVKKYSQALTVLSNSHPRLPHERFLFGELILSLQSATARLGIGDNDGAVKDFIKAYELSFNGEFEMPFIELGKSFYAMSIAVLGHKDSKIPKSWITNIGRKASVYIKKTSVIANSYKRDEGITVPIRLSKRELDVLNDLYHGLSREEMAAHLYLSVNTVKKSLQSLYSKLNATNSVDAIRIAIERKLIN